MVLRYLPFRIFAALVLALVMGVTSLSLAIARGQSVGTIEICSSFGLQTISVDADGQPAGPPHLCPDGIAAFVAPALAAPCLPALALGVVGEALPVWQADPVCSPVLPVVMARGPPVLS